ncbi:DEKNAAC101189 [Brettanomyces naardenensis]|uniref:DEKNAAC101189 n=1 Tax=Brettanomyces naardenensis TaxID=13370 RepID=A0A448YHA8_BRENA|nr:DEKNAAC101189 [Brettanomyces naardenensis]
MVRFSGLQKEVLSLYRDCLRAAFQKPIDRRQHWINYIHSEFNKSRNIPRRDFSTVEYLIRTGKRRYEMYKSPDIKDVL